MISKKLSEYLREETKNVHFKAEKVEFIQRFFRGTIDIESYKKLLIALYFIYDVLEIELHLNRTNQFIEPIYFKELIRKPLILVDLEFYAKGFKINEMIQSHATAKYVNRFKTISVEKPELLIAHSYVRYLGDLSGGQILKNVIKKSFNLETNLGTAFYNFDEIENISAFKENYRSALDKLDFNDIQKNEITEEAILAFELNINVFEELSK